jgi:hypothetical protein
MLIYDRQSVGQSVLVSGTHLGPATNFSFSLKFSLDSCGFVFCIALSDERTGFLFTVQLLLGLARAATLGSKSHRTHGHILLSHLRLPQPGGPGPRIYILQEQGGPAITWSWSSSCGRQVSRPVRLGNGPPFGILDQILSCSSSFVWQLHSFAINASYLTRKRVCNLLYNGFWALPEQSHLSRSPTEFTAISYCLIWESPNLEGQVPVFISPRNRVAQLYPRALGSLSVAPYDSRGLRWKYSKRIHTG